MTPFIQAWETLNVHLSYSIWTWSRLKFFSKYHCCFKKLSIFKAKSISIKSNNLNIHEELNNKMHVEFCMDEKSHLFIFESNRHDQCCQYLNLVDYSKSFTKRLRTQKSLTFGQLQKCSNLQRYYYLMEVQFWSKM